MYKLINIVFGTRKHELKNLFRSYSVSVHVENNLDLEQKVLKVAVIGVPNAGKSTFINNLMDRKVCPTSSKVHTTRTQAKAIFTDNNAQIVFLDTPGLVNFREHRRHHLERSFLKDSEKTLQEADIIGVIHDVYNVWSREMLDIKVIKLLESHISKPSFLVLNKVDMLKSKRKLLDITRIITNNCIKGKPVLTTGKFKNNDNIKSWPNFEEIFMVSSLTGNGLSQVKNYLIDNAKPGEWLFDSETWTDQKPEDIVVNTVKAILLDFLQQEIPYQLVPEMEYFEMKDDGAISTVVIVKCATQRIARLVAGDNDGRLRQMMEKTQKDLQNAFQRQVRIRIVLAPPKNEK